MSNVINKKDLAESWLKNLVVQKRTQQLMVQFVFDTSS